MQALVVYKPSRHFTFGQPALANSDKSRGQTADHVVAKTFGPNGKADGRGPLGAHLPRIGQPLPVRGNDVSTQRIIRRLVDGTTTEGAKVVGAEDVGASPVHGLDVEGTGHGPAPRIVQGERRRLGLEDQVAVLAPLGRVAGVKRRINLLGLRHTNSTTQLQIKRLRESVLLRGSDVTKQRIGKIDVNNLREGVHTRVGAASPHDVRFLR